MGEKKEKVPAVDDTAFKLLRTEVFLSITKQWIDEEDKSLGMEEVETKMVKTTVRDSRGKETTNSQVYATFLTDHSLDEATVKMADIETHGKADHIAARYEDVV